MASLKQCKDAIEIEAAKSGILISREKQFHINYKGNILAHKYFADFLFEDQVIVEVKAVEGAINDLYIAQTLNYLKVSSCKVGLIINFGRRSLEYKRLVY
jgi:GxxExxY protein